MVLSHAVFKLQTVVEAAMEIAGLRAAQKRLQVCGAVVGWLYVQGSGLKPPLFVACNHRVQG